MNRYGADESEQLHLDRVVLRRAWRFALPYRRQLLVNVFFIGLATAAALLPPLIFKALLDNAIPQRDIRLVNLLFAAAIAIAVVTTTLNVINRWLSASIGEGLIYDLRVQLYQHVQRMPIGFFTRTQTGSLLSRLNNDVVGAQATVTTAATFLADVLAVVATLTVMFLLSWKVTVLALLILPLYVLLDRKLGRRIAALSRKRMQHNADMTSTMQERFNVSGALIVKLFGRQREEVQGFERRAGAVRDVGVQMALVGRVYYGALVLFGSIGTATVYWLGAHSAIDGTLTIGTLTALAAYVVRLYDPLTSIASARVDLLNALVSFDRCFEVLDAPLAITDKPNAEPLTKPKGHVRFDGVWFRYPAASTQVVRSLEAVSKNPPSEQPSEWILRNIDLDIEAGKTVALVGASGAGKTTLSSLLPRLYDVDRGTVTIDGHDVRDVTLETLTAAIGVVSQDTHLFHESIAANLRFAQPGATDADLVVVAKAARIHHVIEALPDRYDTVVGERGYRLSGGEKQRLAIARVLLKQPAVVILDEATAHLDSETEQLVQAALNEALSGRTAVIIAHRLSTIRSADMIVVLRNGEVVEQGTHETLLGSGGLYSLLHDTQYTSR